MTDVELNARVTALEENGGRGNYFNGKSTDQFDTIPENKHLSFMIFCTIFIHSL